MTIRAFNTKIFHVHDWAISTVRQLVAAECERLAQRFKPEQKQPVSEILKKFSMSEFLAQAELLAPLLARYYGRLVSLSLRPKKGAIKGNWCVFSYYP